MDKADKEILLWDIVPLIHKMVTDFSNRGLLSDEGAIEAQDLVQTGMMAAWEALDKFDPDRGIKFITYAYPSIYRAIREEVRKLGGPMTIPQKFMMYVITSVAEADAAWAQKYGESPTLEELLDNDALRKAIRAGAEYKDIADDVLDNHIKSAVEYLEGQNVSFDALESDEEYDDLIDTLPDESLEADPEGMYENEEFIDTLSDALEMLPERQREVLELRFGLVDGQEYTLREAGEHLGVSQETIRKLESRALQTLRRLPIRFELQDYLED